MTDIGLQFKSSSFLSARVNLLGRVSRSCELFPCDCKCHTGPSCPALMDQGCLEELGPSFFSLLLLHAFPLLFSIFIFTSVYFTIPLS